MTFIFLYNLLIFYFCVFQAITKGDEWLLINLSYHVELFQDSDGSRDNHICSGIVIFERWVLTSGECVPSQPHNNTLPWAFVGFRRYRGGGTSSTWVMQTKTAHLFDSSASCKKNPLLIYELPYNVPGVTTINITADAVASHSRPCIIGVSRESNMSELLYLDMTASSVMCGCANENLCVSEGNATGHLDDHDSGAALLMDGNLVGVNSYRVNDNLIAFTDVYKFRNWIIRIVNGSV